MSLTLLQLVDRASGELGLQQPSIVIGSGTNQTMQLLALIQRLGLDLVREYEWQQLVKAYRFTTTAALSKTGTTVSGSAVITGMSNTTSVAAGMVVSGTGISQYSEVSSVDSGTQITLDTPATAAGTGATLTIAYQDYALPSGFDRMISDTSWNRTDFWQNMGPSSSQQWQRLQAESVLAGRERFRIYGNYLRLFPALTTAYNFAYEYVSNFWVIATGGTTGTKSAYTVDTDLSVFPDDLMLCGLKYYFRRAKGFDFSADLAEFNDILSTRKGQDQPAPALSMTRRHVDPSLYVNVPAGNWDIT